MEMARAGLKVEFQRDATKARYRRFGLPRGGRHVEGHEGPVDLHPQLAVHSIDLLDDAVCVEN